MKTRWVAVAILLLPGLSATRADSDTMSHNGDEHKDHTHGNAMHGALGLYSMKREASGTSWQPEATPMGGLHLMPGEWMFMLHGFADVVYDNQGGKRGTDGFYSPNMVMLMGTRPLGPGIFGVHSMFSLEPAKISRRGYPELSQAGETADGRTPLIDRQHPHDLFM